MPFAEKLKELRRAAGLSQAELGQLVDVSRNAVSQWEAGTTEPSTKRLQSLAAALRVPIDHLIGATPDYEGRIIEAARRLFARLGFDETSIEVICAAADVSRHEFDVRFASKDDLLYEVLTNHFDRGLNGVRPPPPHDATASSRLRYLLHASYAKDLAHLKLTAAFHSYSWRWNEAREDNNHRQVSEFHETVVTLLEQGANNGEFQHANFRAASEAIFSAYINTLRRALFASYDADKLIAHLDPQLDIILSGLGCRGEPDTPPGPGGKAAAD